jgi:hypothetical protein
VGQVWRCGSGGIFKLTAPGPTLATLISINMVRFCGVMLLLHFPEQVE